MQVKFAEIEQAYEFVSFGAPYDHQAYLCKESGQIFYASESGDLNEVPEDIEDEKYIEIPTKRDLNLGKELVLDFVAEHVPDELQSVDAMFRRKGAYSRFKAFLEDRNLLQPWYDYESKAQAAALRRWCEDNEIELSG
jgi:hypothetical protein